MSSLAISVTVRFPTRVADVEQSLQSSEYLQTLNENPKEQQLKNSYVANSFVDLTKYYAGSTLPVQPDDQPYIKSTATKLYTLYKGLPRCEFQFVMVHPEASVELGTTSFTVSNVIFLNENAIKSSPTIVHEMVHVLQRVHSKWFHRLCTKLRFRDVTSKLKPLLLASSQCISNPDAERIYEDYDGEVVVYDYQLHKKVLLTRSGEFIPLDPRQSVSVVGADVPYDSVSEMVAVRFGSFLNDSQLREQVNDFLRSVRQ